MLDYGKSSKIQAGPYELHYAKNGSNDFVLLAEGNWNILSRYTGEGTDVYLDGRPFINFQRASDGSLTNLSMSILGADGKVKVTFVDRDVDGQWDMKFDGVTRKVFSWKDGQWVQH